MKLKSVDYLFWVGGSVVIDCIYLTSMFGLNIGLKSYFVITKFPQKWWPKGIENLSNLEYMHARLNITVNEILMNILKDIKTLGRRGCCLGENGDGNYGAACKSLWHLCVVAESSNSKNPKLYYSDIHIPYNAAT